MRNVNSDIRYSILANSFIDKRERITHQERVNRKIDTYIELSKYRIFSDTSLHLDEKIVPLHLCISYRVISCYGDLDVCECPICGKQVIKACNSKWIHTIGSKDD